MASDQASWWFEDQEYPSAPGLYTAYVGPNLAELKFTFPEMVFEVAHNLRWRLVRNYHEVQVLRLADVEPEVIATLLDWAHAFQAQTLGSFNPIERAESNHLVKLYAFAHQYEITELQDIIMTSLIEDCQTKKHWWNCGFSREFNALNSLAAQVPCDDRIHQLLVESLVNSTLAEARSDAEDIMDNIPNQLLRLAFTSMLKSNLRR
ncbi:hypothetical protein Daus18300_007288 [Diaporthe australafricana]|uniref:BTB domain-containing protein n=1 Tax=Diaporthe australafricana TaxID=127596 RepID=A0ABR3WNY6_9PEZI